jgi:signal transduction histidine kinase
VRLSIRARLTVLYGGLFLLAGLTLNAVTYLLVKHALDGDAVRVEEFTAGPSTSGKVLDAKTGKQLTVEQLNQVLLTKQAYYRAETLHTLLAYSSAVLLVVALVALALGLLVTGRALRPLHDVTGTARRVAERNLHERIPLPGSRDALRELAETFNAMLARLDRAFDGQRRFAANASHELKTPLAITRTLLEVALTRPSCPPKTRTLAETLLTVNARHERLIDGLLLLTRADRGLTDPAPVDLSELATHVVARCTPEAAAAGVTLRGELAGASGPAGEIEVAGDPVLLERMVDNLVRNGIRHNRDEPGGWVGITLRRVTGRAELVLEVVNSGPSMAGYDVPRLFEPFQRGEGERLRADRGSGLGLSIVRTVATAHGGTVTAEPGPPGTGGLVVTVTLPGSRRCQAVGGFASRAPAAGRFSPG